MSGGAGTREQEGEEPLVVARSLLLARSSAQDGPAAAHARQVVGGGGHLASLDESELTASALMIRSNTDPREDEGYDGHINSGVLDYENSDEGGDDDAVLGEEDPQENDQEGAALDDEDRIHAADEILAAPNATVKDLQEAINVSHPFGLKIWKSALYKKNRSINAITYSDLHQEPLVSSTKSWVPPTLRNPCNALWALLFGWWLAAAYLAVAGIILVPLAACGAALTLVIRAVWYLFFCRACRQYTTLAAEDSPPFRYALRAAKELERSFQYARVLFNLAGYIFWPFGKFIAKRRAHCDMYDPKLPVRKNFDGDFIPADQDDAGQQDNIDDDHHDHLEHINELSALLPNQSRSHVVDISDRRISRTGSASQYLRNRKSIIITQSGTTSTAAPKLRDLDELSSLSSNAGDDDDEHSSLHHSILTERDVFTNGQTMNGRSALHNQRIFPGDEEPPPASSTSWSRRFTRIRNGGFAGFVFSIACALIIGPLQLFASGCCFFFVFSVPMAKLNYVLLRHMMRHPLRLSSHWPEEREVGISRPSNKEAVGASPREAVAPHTLATPVEYSAENVLSDPSMSTTGARATKNVIMTPHVLKPIVLPAINSSSRGSLPVLSLPGQSHDNNAASSGPSTPAQGLLRRPIPVRPHSIFVDADVPMPIQPREPPASGVEEFRSAPQDYQIVLCTYNAAGLRYYKYTVDGVNIIFINLMALVLFTLVDFYYLGQLWHYKGISSYSVIFICALLSVVPLSYFIGMGVSSITAQTGSLALGAVINATFGSIIEVLLYCIALIEGKSRMVEGAIVGSFMAGLLALPGASMLTGGLRRKEQRFNSKSATVTSTMLIISLIGAFGPTFFHDVYGTFELQCLECPSMAGFSDASTKLDPITMSLACKRCRYIQPPPTKDPIYENHTRPLMYCCATALVLVYGVGLLFTLRTHSRRIYRPEKKRGTKMLKRILDAVSHLPHAPVSSGSVALSQQPGNAADEQSSETLRLSRRLVDQSPRLNLRGSQRFASEPNPRALDGLDINPSRAIPHVTLIRQPVRTETRRTVSTSASNSKADDADGTSVGSSTDTDEELFESEMEHSETRIKFSEAGRANFRSGGAQNEGNADVRNVTSIGKRPARSDSRRAPEHVSAAQPHGHGGGAGGHDHPNWSAVKSILVLLGATVLFSMIAEVLIECVDHVIESGGGITSANTGKWVIDEKFLGLTLFAIVPTITEFYNAIAFAQSGNIALSLEIGSAYTIQVALLQIPILVAFSAYWRVYGHPPRQREGLSPNPSPLPFDKISRLLGASGVEHPSSVASFVGGGDTFTLVFPRWDLIAVLFSVFTVTYLYIEGKSNYFKGAMLLLAYAVLMLAFYFAPSGVEAFA